MKKREVCILFGGKSGEHEVSLKSAASVVLNLDAARYNVRLIGIDKQGAWYLQEKAYFQTIADQGEALQILERDKPVTAAPGRGLWANSEKIPTDIVFPVLHGTYGEDGTVQGLLEIADLPYVGAGVLGSSLAMDKEKSKIVWSEADLPVVDYLVIRSNSPAEIKRIEELFAFPFFVKPASTGSSVGITKVYSSSELPPALSSAFRFDVKVLIEAAVDAREIECSVLGNSDPQAFTPGEIIPSHDFYDYEAKYIDPQGALLKIPAEISKELQDRIKDLALAAFRSVECAGMARVDFFLEHDSDRVYINEINTIPGFTNISMYPKLCEASGLAYPELLARLIDLGLESYARRRGLHYSIDRQNNP